MTPREAAGKRLAEAFREKYLACKALGWPWYPNTVDELALIAAEAIDAALDEHHCGCCDGGWDGEIDPWDAVLPSKEAVK